MSQTQAQVSEKCWRALYWEIIRHGLLIHKSSLVAECGDVGWWLGELEVKGFVYRVNDNIYLVTMGCVDDESARALTRLYRYIEEGVGDYCKTGVFGGCDCNKLRDVVAVLVLEVVQSVVSKCQSNILKVVEELAGI